jgi:hypothetical protein
MSGHENVCPYTFTAAMRVEVWMTLDTSTAIKRPQMKLEII